MAFTPPWWLIAVLVVGAVILIYLNWPGPEGDPRYLWKDHENTGWYVFRSWHDPEILSSFGALLASLGRSVVGSDRSGNRGRLRRVPHRRTDC